MAKLPLPFKGDFFSSFQRKLFPLKTEKEKKKKERRDTLP